MLRTYTPLPASCEAIYLSFLQFTLASVNDVIDVIFSVSEHVHQAVALPCLQLSFNLLPALGLSLASDFLQFPFSLSLLRDHSRIIQPLSITPLTSELHLNVTALLLNTAHALICHASFMFFVCLQLGPEVLLLSVKLLLTSGAHVLHETLLIEDLFFLYLSESALLLNSDHLNLLVNLLVP